jgi:hypothetical protein
VKYSTRILSGYLVEGTRLVCWEGVRMLSPEQFLAGCWEKGRFPLDFRWETADLTWECLNADRSESW